MKSWTSYVENPNMKPPKRMNTTDLVDKVTPDYVLLKPGLSPRKDFEVIPEQVFRQLVSWYASIEG